MKLTDSAIRRPVTTFMVVVGLVVFGFIGISRMKVNFYPDVVLPTMVVVTMYPGAGPLEVESEVTDPMEERLGTVQNLQDITSRSVENISVILLQFEWGGNLDAASSDVRDRLDMVQPFLPDDVQKPFIFKFDPSMMPVLQLTLSGDLAETELTDIIEEVGDRLQRVTGVAAVNIMGGTRRQAQVVVDLPRLAASGITLDQFTMVLKGQNINYPIGSVSTEEQRYLVRLVGQYEDIEAIRATAIGATRTGRPILVRDVADVSWAPEEIEAVLRVNGRSAIFSSVQRRPDANTVTVANALLAEIEDIRKTLPPGADLQILWDSSESIKGSVTSVATNLILGGILASMVLFVFLRRFRATMFVAFAIPISIFFALFFMYLFGFTINILSMAGLAIAVGMVVDNGVVVFESIFRRREQGEEPVKAASEGTASVAMAITASTLTTIAVFLPLLLLQGIIQVFFKELSLAVVFSLVASLGVALTLIPMLASRFLKLPPPGTQSKGFRAWSERTYEGVETRYERLLGWAVNHRKLVIILSVVLLLASFGTVPFIGTEFMPEQFENFHEIYAEMPVGTSIEKTDEAVTELEGYIVETWGDELEMLAVQTGGAANMFAAIFGEAGANNAEIDLVLKDRREREHSTDEIDADIRRRASEIPGLVVRAGKSGGMGSAFMGGGAALQVDILGHDLESADSLVSLIMSTIDTIPGLVDVEASRKAGSPEVRLVVDREKAALYGLTPYQVGSALRTMIEGNVPTRFRDEGDEYDILVRLKKDQRGRISDILSMSINGPMGPVLLRNVVTPQPGTSPLEIEHKNTERIVSITANVVGQSAGQMAQRIGRAIAPIPVPPGFEVKLSGSYEDMMESFRDLGFAVLIAVLLVFMVMASQFESFRDPFIIMFTMPFAVIGVLWALLITGTTLSVVSGIGVLVLIGIVVNNGIVLIDHINQLRRKRKLPLEQAVRQGGRVRLRPILMTAFTTIFGLLPLALQIGEGSEFWSPLGRAIIGGMVVSTFLTLVLIPVLYMSFEAGAEKRRLRKEAQRATPDA